MKYTSQEINGLAQDTAAQQLAVSSHWTWQLVMDFGQLSTRAWLLHKSATSDERKERSYELYTLFRSRETSAYQCHNDLVRILNRIYEIAR